MFKRQWCQKSTTMATTQRKEAVKAGHFFKWRENIFDHQIPSTTKNKSNMGSAPTPQTIATPPVAGLIPSSSGIAHDKDALLI